MIDDNRLEKVEILIQQKRFADSEKLLADLITEHVNNTSIIYLLAEVYLQQDKYDDANQVIDTAIGLSPDSPDLFYTKSRIAFAQDNLKVAEENIHRAIEIDPFDANYFAIDASIQLRRKRFEESLEAANRALEIDSENLLALNTRSTALSKLNRTEESFETIEGALHEDPNNAYTHANYGWNLLEKGDHKKALEHFKESLSHDPSLEYAQMGILESLKATNLIYRLFLKYSFFMSNLTSKYQWGVIIGFYIGFRVLRSVARNNESLEPYLTPFLILLALVAFSTWVMTPISNLFLRFNKFGQLLLDKKEKMSSNFVALSLGLSLIGVILYLIRADEKMLSIAAFGFAMMLPLGSMLSETKNKYGLILYTIALAGIGLAAIAMTFSTGNLFNSLTIIFIFGFIGFQWVANYLIIKKNDYE